MTGFGIAGARGAAARATEQSETRPTLDSRETRDRAALVVIWQSSATLNAAGEAKNLRKIPTDYKSRNPASKGRLSSD